MPKAKQKTRHTLTQEYVESSESSDSEYNSDNEAMLFQGKDPVLDRTVDSDSDVDWEPEVKRRSRTSPSEELAASYSWKKVL